MRDWAAENVVAEPLTDSEGEDDAAESGPHTWDASAAAAEAALRDREAAMLSDFVRNLILRRPGSGTDDARLHAAAFYHRRVEGSFRAFGSAGWCESPADGCEVWHDVDGHASIVDGAPVYTPWAQPFISSGAARRRDRARGGRDPGPTRGA